MTTEEWKVIDGYGERYTVSNTGKVRREVPTHMYTAHSLLSYNIRRNYRYVQLWNRETKRRDSHAVHQLVATYFIGPCPDGKTEVNHRDGDPTNNHVDNLEWVTHQENQQHAFDELNRESLKGEQHGCAKLTEADIYDIRAMFRDGLGNKEIAIKYGVTRQAIRAVRLGISWKHIPEGGE